MYLNGLLIQELGAINKAMYYLPNNYRGVHCLYDDPLLQVETAKVSELQHERMFDRPIESHEICNAFIFNSDLARRYVSMCKSLNFDIRILFIESDYSREIWKEEKPKGIFLGYEVSEIPLGIMTLYDLHNSKRFEKYRTLLNENGLFSNEHDAYKFKNEYKALLEQALVGDGNVDVYVCAVYEVDVEAFLSQFQSFIFQQTKSFFQAVAFLTTA